MRPAKGIGLNVCAFVYNNCLNDARVLKEATTLAAAGYNVTVFAFKDHATEYVERKSGFTIIRVERRPLNARILSVVNQLVALSKRSRNTVREYLLKFLSLFVQNRDTEMTGEKTEKRRMIHTLRENGVSYTFNQFYQRHRSFTLFGGWLLVFPSLVLIFLMQYLLQFLRAIFVWFVKHTKNFINLFRKPLSYIDFYHRCLEHIDLDTVHILHCHDMNTLYLGQRIKKKNRSIFLVYDSHELYVERNRPIKPGPFKIALLKYLEKRYCRLCDAVITVGHCIADELSKRYDIPRPIVVMNAPSRTVQRISSDLSLRKELSIPDDLKLMLYAGGITFNRGLDKVIQSLRKLEDFYLVLLGYGKADFLKGLRQTAVSTGVTDRFSFYGPVPPDRVTSYISGADLGVAPIENVCLSYYYCAPNKVFEYLVSGIPVIASDFPEMSAIIDKYKVGCTFDPDSVDSIVSAARKVVDNGDAYLKMQENTREAASTFNWETESRKLTELYKNLMRVSD